MKSLRYVTEGTAVLVSTHANRRYLTGFPSSVGYLLMTHKGNKLFVDSRYFEAANKKVVDSEVVLTSNLWDQLNTIMKEERIQRLLIETETELAFYRLLKTKLQVKVVPSQPLSDKLLNLRSVKKREEIESIVAAQRIAERAFDDILNFIKAGVSEREIAALLEYKMKIYGAEGIAFGTIAVSGANSSLPHGVPTDKTVAEGDFVTMDFGGVINGYCSDMTRTVAVGHATDEMIKVYNTVLSAQENVIKTVKSGIICKDADAAARDVITQAGYGECFGHSTGHGVGLHVHERPNLSPAAQGVKLRAGQVITAEPGIYIPGKFGVRIEDMLLVRKNDCKNLTKAPKHLIIL
jgi:Xaa-Pro aminopeptidase